MDDDQPQEPASIALTRIALAGEVADTLHAWANDKPGHLVAGLILLVLCLVFEGGTRGKA